jgi:hypothetical protein
MAARITLKTITVELVRRGHKARLERSSGYFYFFGGEAADWLDRTVQVTGVNALTLEAMDGRVRAAKKGGPGDYGQDDPGEPG